MQNEHPLFETYPTHLAHKLNRIKKQEHFRSRNEEKFQSLTNREVEILRLVARGHNNPTVARLLFISRLTVEQHRKNINRKLQINSAFKLFQFGLAFDLI